jgi:Pyruvate/2-oxoacid:ferredoxin oxidoreductase delta subunit
MAEEVYRKFCEAMAERGGRYPGVDIPEFYAMIKALYAPEEAEVFLAIPRGLHPAGTIARAMGKPEEEVENILETMADKGLCQAGEIKGMRYYCTLPFVPGIFEFQFMRGTKTDRDKNLARLIHQYKSAVDAAKGPPKLTFPVERVIPVDRTIKAGNAIHTYDQVATYIEKYEPLSVSTCFCRHVAKLVDESDDCGKPDDVCMQFGMGAQFVIDRGMGRKISKDEAREILQKSEEAGLVHCSANRQEIDFICNCCGCHCMFLQTALAQPKPGVSLNSGFYPIWDAEFCTACETCIDRCPTRAIAMGDDNVPQVNLDLCVGCGVCATGCPEDAIALVERPGMQVPPVDHKELKAAIKASRA